MARTESTMLPLGTQAPDFSLLDPRTNTKVGLRDIQGSKGTLVMFICNHCPFVKHILPELTAVCHQALKADIGVIAINANDIEHYHDDAPEHMASLADNLAWQFPYVFDDTQAIASAYQAACTPDFFLFDKDLTLVYRGQFDASTPGNNVPVTGDSLQQALNDLTAGNLINPEQKPSVGCNIKWKE